MKKGIIATAALMAALTIGNAGYHSAHHVGPTAAYPSVVQTPGVINENVTQANINSTICKSGWTATIRPPVSYTNKLKAQQLLDLKIAKWIAADYEEDHFISIEIGGNPTDPHNLWPMPYNLPVGGAREKDQVENFLKREVCAGKMTLAQAQKAIVTDWYAIYSAGQADGESKNDLSDQ